MYKYLRKKRIKINGGRGDIAYRLADGDIIDLYINDEFFGEKQDLPFMSAKSSLDILFEDENILLLNKKQGLLCHSGDEENNDTLISRMQRYLYEKGEYDPYKENQFAPALANRIDRNTGGIVIAAKNAEALRILNEKIKQREIDKYYLCIVHGTPLMQEATITAYLRKDSQQNKVYIKDTPFDGALTIKTRYRVLSSKGDYSLLEIELLTGRTHQIRAHMAHIGHPLLGDGKYGVNAQDKKLGFKSQALCSYKIRFSFSSDAGLLEYLNGREYKLNDVWFVKDFYEHF